MIQHPHAQRGRRPAAAIAPLAAQLRRAALPLSSPDDLDPLIDAIGDARFVLLGEATHGTSEFYRWRADITKRLVREKNFSFIAVEGDWPDCYRVNRYAKWLSGAGANAEEVLHAFKRWPTWMWPTAKWWTSSRGSATTITGSRRAGRSASTDSTSTRSGSR